MYGQNLGGRPDAPGEPIFTKFCMRVRVPDAFLSFEFQKDRMKNVGAVGVEISPLPLTRHIAYTTACCYRTSRDVFPTNFIYFNHVFKVLNHVVMKIKNFVKYLKKWS